MPRKRQFGSIRSLRSGRFQARFTAPDGSIVNGPKTFASKRRADDWLAVQHAALLRDEWVDPSLGTVTVTEYAEQWLEDREHHLEASTFANYSDHIRRFVTGPYPRHDVSAPNPHLGAMQLRHVTPAHIAQWHRWVREVSAAGANARAVIEEGSPRWNRALRTWARTHDQQVAATGRIPVAARAAWKAAGCPGLPAPESTSAPGGTQAAAAYRTISGLFSEAQRTGRVVKNPCTLKGAGSSDSRRRCPASLDELNRIVELFPTRYAAAVVVAAWGGLRAGEVFGLARRHVDFTKGAISVQRAMKRARNGVDTFGKPKTRAGRREVHLPPGAMALLRAHMEAFTGAEPDALVFSTRNGRALSSSQRTAMFRRAADTVGRPDLSFHDLRHTGATLAAENGATTAQLMRRFGHTTPRAALIYQHALDDSDRRLAERLEQVTL